MRKIFGWIFLAAGIFCLVAPQSLMGLNELKFLYTTSFAGEAMVGMLFLCIAYYLIGFHVNISEKYKKMDINK